MADPGFDSRTSHRFARTVAGATTFEVELGRTLSEPELDQLRAGARQAMSSPSGGALPLFDADISPFHVSLRTLPIPADAVRLDALFAAFAAWGSPLGSPISAYLVCRVAEALAAMRRAERLPPIVDRAGVLVGGDGSVHVLAFGVPVLDALLRPEGAPDVRRGNNFDVRDDVRALGTLYCELLSGQSHGARPLPDPRPSLFEVLKPALAADPSLRYPTLEAFAESVARESASFVATDPRSTLARLIDQWVGREVPRGDVAFAARYRTAIDRIEVIGAPVLPEATIPRGAVVAEAPVEDAWSEVLGEKIEKEPPRVLVSPPVVAAAMPQLLDIEKMTGGRSSRVRAASRERPSSKGLAMKIAAVALSAIVAGGVWTAVRFQSAAIEHRRDIEPPIADPPPQYPPPDTKPSYETAHDTEPVAPKEAPKEGTATNNLLTVMSRPLGATVELDGGYVGKTPLVRKEPLAKQDYQVTLTLKGYKPWTKQVFVDKTNGSLNVMAVLESEQ